VLVDADVTVGEVVSPIDVSAPTANVEVYQGVVADCTGVANYQLDVPIGAGEDVTVVAYWSVNDGPTLGSYVNDESCVDAGSARVSAFQAADYGGASITDVYYQPQMTPPWMLLFDDLANGTFRSADVVAGDYDAAFFDSTANPDVDPSLGELNPINLPEGTSAVMFLAGGNDGESGAFAIYSQVPVCTPSTTPSTAATSSSTPAAATGAAAVTPAFTG